MRRRADPFLPWLVLLGSLLAAAVVSLLLTSAERRGIDALEDSIGGEVQAIAASQDQRFQNTFGATSGLSNPEEPFELTVDSPADLLELQELLDLFGDSIESGFYLLDAQGRVTQGVLFTGDPVGSAFEWPGFDELVSTPTYAQGIGGVLPVSQGLTTDQPVLAYLIPVVDQASGRVRGSFVFESVVAADSDFNREIGALRRGETGEYLFYDDRGSVIASNDPSLIAEMLTDQRLLTESAGVHRFGDEIVVLAEVPAAGWRVAFRQDSDEFEGSLAEPLESVGRVLIFVLLAAGALLTVILNRRLRASRAEAARLAAISEAQQEFISIVSHELRTPVAGVLGFLETTLDHWDAMDDEERRGAVARAASNARRLQGMTRDVLDTQSVETGRLVHVLARVDLGVEVQAAVSAAQDADSERTIDVRRPSEPVWVSADSDRLQQVLANLIDNACKNSPAVEPVDVLVEVEGGEARVTVSDHGAGIDDESLERIFEKFVRGRGESVRGTGLGLYISRQIINAHGGRIWAESTPGEGAAFRFVLPLEDRSASA
jgi:signal transduction histidine kinase